jgi:hypothetical protein
MSSLKSVDNDGMTTKNERGGMIKGLLMLAVLIVVLFDVGSIVFNLFTLDSTADDIANQVSTVSRLEAISNQRQLKEQAAALAKESDARLTKFSVGSDGIIRLSLRREAKTLVVGRIGAIEDWAKANGDGQAVTE